MVSREVDKAEKAKGAFPINIAKDAVFATISSKNPSLANIQAKGISLKKFGDIFINNRITTWKQAVGGVDSPVHVYTRADACGAASAWAAILGKYKQGDLKGVGIYGDPGLMETLQRDPLGIGFNNLGFLFTRKKITPGIVIVPIDANNNGKVDPNERIDSRDKAYQEVAAGRYPGSRREYFVTKGQPKDLAKAFIEYALSEEGTKVLKDVGGYVPLTDKEQKAELGRF
jgi:phosphate transport system substrate-binding protein